MFFNLLCPSKTDKLLSLIYTELEIDIKLYISKLDRVGLVENRPFTKLLHPFVRIKKNLLYKYT